MGITIRLSLSTQRNSHYPALKCLLALVLVFVLVSAARGQESLRVAVPSLPPGMGNPFTTASIPGVDIYLAMFNGLSELHESGELRPALATGWEAKDPHTWEFSLRRDVSFANGKPFDAESVAAVIRLLKQPEAQRWSVAREVSNIKGATVLSSHRIRISTHMPDLMLPARFAAIMMIEPEYWAEIGPESFSRRPVGTGPYKVENWSTQGILMSAHDQAWRSGLAHELEVLLVPESAARLSAVQTGASDIALFMGPEDAPMIEAAGGRLVAFPQGSVIGLAYILVEDTVFSDPRVRQAMTYAVNRQQITDIIFAGATEPASQPAPNSAFGYNADLKPYPYDPERARALLIEANYPNGFTFRADVVTPQPTDTLLWQQVAADLAKVGITMELNTMTFARFIRGLYQGQWTGQAFGMNYNSLPALDPLIGMQFHSCLSVEPWICDAEQTNLIKSAMSEFDAKKRRESVQSLMRMAHEEPIGLYLYERVRFDALGPRIKSFRAPFGYTSFHDIEFR